MSPSAPVLARDNPFSAERVHRISYRLDGSSWEEMITRLASLRYRAAIVGPHGTGKTTLLEDLAERLTVDGWTVKGLRLTEDRPAFPAGYLKQLAATLSPLDIILLDGAEQLSALGWRLFCYRVRSAGGLIITAHQPGRLPTLWQTSTSSELLAAIVRTLLGEREHSIDALAERLFRKHRGNLRDAIRELYDLAAAGELLQSKDLTTPKDRATRVTIPWKDDFAG